MAAAYHGTPEIMGAVNLIIVGACLWTETETKVLKQTPAILFSSLRESAVPLLNRWYTQYHLSAGSFLKSLRILAYWLSLGGCMGNHPNTGVSLVWYRAQVWLPETWPWKSALKSEYVIGIKNGSNPTRPIWKVNSGAALPSSLITAVPLQL